MKSDFNRTSSEGPRSDSTSVVPLFTRDAPDTEASSGESGTTAPVGFDRVDTAIGGAWNRNNVMRQDDFQPPPDAADVFITPLRFTEDLVTYSSTNPSPTTGRRPSVAGYSGPAWASGVNFDFDAEDPATALTEVRALLNDLRDNFRLDLRLVRVFFSGSKGFHVELDGRLFGGLAPAPCRILMRRIKRVAQALIQRLHLTTLDMGIYDAMRLFRYPNTRHGKTGRYKVPLTAAEVLTLDMTEIISLAREPRDVPDAGHVPFQAVPALHQVWRDAQPESAPAAPPRRSRGARMATGGQEWSAAAEAIAASCPPVGQRHEMMLALCGALARSSLSDGEIEAFVQQVATIAMGEEGRTRADEWRGRSHRLGQCWTPAIRSPVGHGWPSSLARTRSMKFACSLD